MRTLQRRMVLGPRTQRQNSRLQTVHRNKYTRMGYNVNASECICPQWFSGKFLSVGTLGTDAEVHLS